MTSNKKYINNQIEVSDLALASSLQHLGFPVTSISRDPREHPKVSFVFESSDELNNVIQKYWQGHLNVEPKSFWSISRELKSRTRIF
jgi:hypothetical protein